MKKYIPNIYQKSIYTIDYDKLKKKGIKLLSFDIDETISGDREKEPPKPAITLFEDLKKKGFKIILFTNASEIRARKFATLLDVPFYCECKKPLGTNFNKALKKYNLKPSQMCHIGNNRFDDVAGGNSLGIITCLVNNVSGKVDNPEEIKLVNELRRRKLITKNKFYQINESVDMNVVNKRKENSINKFINRMDKSNNFSFPWNKNKSTINNDLELYKPKLDALYDELFEITKQQSIVLNFSYAQMTEPPSFRTRTKLGGTPYWPAEMAPSYPKDMLLYAQINFAELPNLKGYPSSGILQFFTDGWLWDGTNDYSRHKTIYHPNVFENILQFNYIPKTTITDNDDEAPFKGVIPLLGSKMEYQCIQMDVEGFDNVIYPLIEKHLGIKTDSIYYGLPKGCYSYLYNKINATGWGNRIGGYPNFTQSDATDDNYNTLLFQVDSNKDILWGDDGISNIFINDKKLLNKDFSDCLYTWDCY